MAAEIYRRDFWEQTKDRNPHLWSSADWLVWEAMNRLEHEGIRVISARMSRGYTVRVQTESGEQMLKIL